MRTVSSRHRMNDAKEEWLIELYHGDESSFLGVAASDTTFDGSRYLGVIAQAPSISQELDLREMRAIQSISDLVLKNVRYLDGWLHEELTGENGRIYANRKVIVRSVLNGSTDDDVIFTGKMSTLSHDKDEISIRVASFNPAKGVRFPQARTADGDLEPVVLGNFYENSPGATSYATSMALWPAKVIGYGRSTVKALLHADAGSASDARLHLWEPAVDQFIPITGSAGPVDDPFSRADGFVVIDSNTEFILQQKVKAVGTPARGDTWTDFEYAFDVKRADDTESGTSTNKGVILADVGGGLYRADVDLALDMPVLTVPPNTDVTIELRVGVVMSALTMTGLAAYLYNDSGALDNVSLTHSIGTPTWQTVELTCTAAQANNLYLRFSAIDNNATVGSYYVADIRVKTEYQIDQTGDLQAINSLVRGIDTVYCGTDGLTRSWTTGACAEMHEHHRELLIRFAGMATTTPSGFSALDTAHASWDARAWWNETVLLAEVLAKMQREGQFIFDWTAAGLPWYLYVASSYSSGDVDATIVDGVDTEDWIKFEYTDPSDLVSDHTILYQPHPADSSRYLAEETKTNADRSDWAFETEENKIETKLDWLINGVDEYADAVDQLWGTVRQFASFSTTRPLFFVLERGDILQIEDNDRYFMVTRLEMEPGVRDVTMMEVYRP